MPTQVKVPMPVLQKGLGEKSSCLLYYLSESVYLCSIITD